MTYTVQSVAALSDIPAAISTFSTARGWASGGAGNIVHPITGQSYNITTSGNFLTVTAVGSGLTSVFRLPYLNGAYPSSPVVSLPSQVHLLGNNSPYVSPDSEPYIACIVECGYNQYRHIYIGSLVKAGAFTDGDLFSTNNFYEAENATITSILYNGDRNRFLFGGYTQNNRPGGGAKISHASNLVTWRDFVLPLDGAGSTNHSEFKMDGTEIFGGNGDGTNDGFVYRGHADYGAAQVLVPANLYVSKGNLGAAFRFIPVGHASGVRLIDLKNLSPGQQVTIGSDQWRVFPEFTKSALTSISRASGVWFPQESSHNLGLAYKE